MEKTTNVLLVIRGKKEKLLREKMNENILFFLY